MSRVELMSAAGQILFEWELYFEPGELEFRQPVQLQEGVSYTLRAETSAYGNYLSGTGEFTVALTLLGDLNGDWLVNVTDLLTLLAAWGPCPACPADLNGDEAVDVLDLLLLLGNWS